MSDYNTPMMRQYKDIKEKHPDAFLFFRCGDFYEIFGDDAVKASKILDITLTKRQNKIPMCGVPYHAVDVYVAKMVKAGRKVAICEQMEDPKNVKGIVKRDVSQIITPGTLVEENLLVNNVNNYILALGRRGLYLEISCLDLSTGDFEVNEFECAADYEILKSELVRIMPREIIIPEDVWAENHTIRELFEETENILVNRYPAWVFEKETTNTLTFEHLGISSWSELGISEPHTDLCTPGVILAYVNEHARSLLSHIRHLNYNSHEENMILDESTIRNLELISNLHDGSGVNTLLEILDKTLTPMGGRLIKKWICSPLISKNRINRRLEIVDFFYRDPYTLDKVKEHLKQIMDLERLVARIVMDKANPKDLISIKNSLSASGLLYELLKDVDILKEHMSSFNLLHDLIDSIDKAIIDEPAAAFDQGNIVKEGYNAKLDELKQLAFKSKEYILGIEAEIKKTFNVPSLKIKYNKILGYFFEVSKVQSKNMDDSFILRQSLVNNHRYTNKVLSEYESKILTAREEINEIERTVFTEIKECILGEIEKIQDNARIIARLDVLVSFAGVAARHHYTKPEIEENSTLDIKEGRHPVLEQKMDSEDFIPNDLDMSGDRFLYIITGPNMAGKSTYLRQNALIVLMAQIGCFVPAYSAKISIVDRIFTRIGTSDNLARGQSTFLVEMTETANILLNATKESLIIMDEIGRGTSTYDGLSIAWAILEYIANKDVLGAKTLFATHYHELCELEKKEGIKNLSVAVVEEGENFTFLHKIIDMPAERSYGIHVAKLARMPEQIIYHAQSILAELEKEKSTEKIALPSARESNGLFDGLSYENQQYKRKEQELMEQLRYLDINRLTPLQALNLLSDLQKKSAKIK